MSQNGWPTFSKVRKLEVSIHGLIDDFSKGLDHQAPNVDVNIHIAPHFAQWMASLDSQERCVDNEAGSHNLHHFIQACKIRGRQPAKPSGIYLPWFSLSFLIFSTYTNVTKIRSTICSPSGRISSEVGCGSLDRRRWYEATRLSLPSPMTSCDYIHRL